mmetsp:Transcript_103167/g.291748  ORF Transcript_103167/g.291748 Transcript_103167/m.291748 type:complete len:112 (+) Transcript_103167:951-1286(+)
MPFWLAPKAFQFSIFVPGHIFFVLLGLRSRFQGRLWATCLRIIVLVRGALVTPCGIAVPVRCPMIKLWHAIAASGHPFALPWLRCGILAGLCDFVAYVNCAMGLLCAGVRV